MDQSETNFSWFQDQLPELMTTNKGQHALLHNKAVEGFFNSSIEAIKAGIMHYGEGNFSVEPVDDKVEDLGFYSHVSSALRA